MKAGSATGRQIVATVALIDKGSVVAALLLAWWVLGEGITRAKLLGGGLIVAGMLVIARGRAFLRATD